MLLLLPTAVFQNCLIYAFYFIFVVFLRQGLSM